MREKHKWLSLAKRNGIAMKVFRRRVRDGWACERAATTPVQFKKNGSEEYALYKGDALIAVGTLAELAESRGVQVKTMRARTYPSYLKRMQAFNGDNFLFVERIDGDEE